MLLFPRCRKNLVLSSVEVAAVVCGFAKRGCEERIGDERNRKKDAGGRREIVWLCAIVWYYCTLQIPCVRYWSNSLTSRYVLCSLKLWIVREYEARSLPPSKVSPRKSPLERWFSPRKMILSNDSRSVYTRRHGTNLLFLLRLTTRFQQI